MKPKPVRILHKATYRCSSCSWMGLIPGKGKKCKACGDPLGDRLPEIEVGSLPCEYGKSAYWRLPPLTVNPEVRLMAGKPNGASPLYVMIYRNANIIGELRCPHCNKISRTNVRVTSGEYQDEIICGKTLPREQGGRSCKTKTIYVFISSQQRKDVIYGEAREKKQRSLGR